MKQNNMTDEQIWAAAKDYADKHGGDLYGDTMRIFKAGAYSRNEEIRQLRKALQQLNTLEKVTNLSDGEIVGIVNKGLNK